MRHAGIEVILRQPLSVEVDVVDASGRHVEASLRWLPFGLERFAQEHCARLRQGNKRAFATDLRIRQRCQDVVWRAIVLNVYIREASRLALWHLVAQVAYDGEGNVVATVAHRVEQHIAHVHAIYGKGRLTRVGGNLDGMWQPLVILIDQRARHTQALQRLVGPVLQCVAHSVDMQRSTVAIGQLHLDIRLILGVMLSKDVLVRIHQARVVGPEKQRGFAVHLHVVANAKHIQVSTIEGHGRGIASDPACASPSRGLVGGGHQARLKPRGGGLALPFPVPYLHLPMVVCLGAKRLARIGDGQRGRLLHPARVPNTSALLIRERQAIGGLRLSSLIGAHLPAETRVSLVQSHRANGVFCR